MIDKQQADLSWRWLVPVSLHRASVHTQLLEQILH